MSKARKGRANYLSYRKKHAKHRKWRRYKERAVVLSRAMTSGRILFVAESEERQ